MGFKELFRVKKKKKNTIVRERNKTKRIKKMFEKENGIRKIFENRRSRERGRRC